MEQVHYERFLGHQGVVCPRGSEVQLHPNRVQRLLQNMPGLVHTADLREQAGLLGGPEWKRVIARPFGEAGLELAEIQGEQSEQCPLVMEACDVLRREGWQHRLNLLAGVIPFGGEPLFAVVTQHHEEEKVTAVPEGVQGESSGVDVVSVERQRFERSVGVGDKPVAIYRGLEKRDLIVEDRAQASFHAPHEFEGELEVENRGKSVGRR